MHVIKFIIKDGFSKFCLEKKNCIRGIIVSVLASSVADRGFEPWSSQTKDYKIGICCFSTKHAVLRRKSKDWLAWNQDNVFEWDDCCFSELAL